MLLVLTSSSDTTADYLCKRLGSEGMPYVRLNTDKCFGHVKVSFAPNVPRLEIGGVELASSDISNVWLRRPGEVSVPVGSDSNESKHVSAEWAEAINGFLAHVPSECWMNHPALNAAASHKLEQLSRADRMGLVVPDTLVTQDSEAFKKFFNSNGGDIIVKPLANGYIQHEVGPDEVIYTSAVKACNDEILALLDACPTFLQSRVRKSVDVRVCVVDDDLTAVAISAFNSGGLLELDVRVNNMEGALYEPILVPSFVSDRILTLVRSYGLRFAAIDLAVNESGNWVFFEINPNGQWAWLDLVGGFDIAGSLLRAFRRGLRCGR